MIRAVILLLLALTCAPAPAATIFFPWHRPQVAEGPLEDPPPDIPGAPGQPQFAQDGDNVDITWSAGTDADAYNFQWGSNDGTPDVVNGSVAPAAKTLTPADFGEAAVESFWFCAWSTNTGGTQVSVNNSCNNWAAPPPEDVTLTWTAPVTGGPVNGYRVYYGTTDGGPYTSSVDVGTSLTWTVSGLTGTQFFIVRAFNGTGEGADSNQVSHAF